ncbi:MATE family efflux transporter [Alteromonas lipolytica]|uniref:Multidrug-efflux transporter n=1 Tax=Alteromonas lipolytica TaxID=1856405 RepID=A0A1E8FHT5_9ALTE|nr:MATE family efflux transporter [Alteromonas lipolytica]OFI35306.1 MATE family efflux transporter [Alteromonas lipolytica]GGF58445.1 MATE family efflux transporter [Alteromonas lipolytica]
MMLLSPRTALESRRLIKLAWPLLIAQITQMLMGVSDTIIAGRYSAVDMAAVALGFSICIPIMSFIQGLALAIPPLIARLQGAKSHDDVANATQQAGYLLLVMSLLPFFAAWFSPSIVSIFPMDSGLAEITAQYVKYVFLAFPSFALYQWSRNYCEALGHTKPSMIITVIGLVVNIAANFLFVYGGLGIEAMGGAGCGVATALVFVAMAIATVIYITYAPRLSRYQLFSRWHTPQTSTILQTLRLGLPIAMTVLFEVTLFAIIALLLAPFGANVVAAHQIALNFSALMFMFPLSMGMAISIRVSFRLGQQRVEQARIAVKSAVVIGLCVACFTACFTLVAKGLIISLYTSDEAVIAISSQLLIYAALFQFSDAIQVISANALRGYKDTAAMFYITFCAYWLIGLPIGVILGRTDWASAQPMAADGFWIGIIAGLTSAAIMLGARLYVVQKRLQSPAI